MSMAITFDTLEFTEDLKSAGIKENEAKAIVKLMKRAQESASIDLATKQDVADVRHANDSANLATKMDITRLEGKIGAIDAKIEGIDSKIESSAEKTKSELIRWVVMVGVLQFALISALILKIVP